MDRLNYAEWMPTPNTSGTIKPSLIVIHDTAGNLKKYNTVKYLQQRKAKASYHIVIEYDGTVVQLADLTTKCWHAGKSQWKGRKYCNSFSIGIALVNPGALKKDGKAWFGTKYDGVVERSSPHHGNARYWLPYSKEQLESLNKVVMDIKSRYPDIEIAAHWSVSPGRKQDCNPLLDLATLGQTVDAEVNALETEEPADKVLAKASRKYKLIDKAKGAAGAGLATLSAAASLENVTSVRTYVDAVTGFFVAYGFWVAIGCLVGGWLIAEALQKWMREDYEEGRSEPSGADEQRNAGAGQWL